MCHNANGIYNNRLALQKLLHKPRHWHSSHLQDKLSTCLIGATLDIKHQRSSLIYGRMAVLVKPNIQHALVKIPMLNLFQVPAIMVQLNGLETVIWAVYQSPSIYLIKDNFGKLTGLSKVRNSYSGKTSTANTDWSSRLARHAGSRQYAYFINDYTFCWKGKKKTAVGSFSSRFMYLFKHYHDIISNNYLTVQT